VYLLFPVRAKEFSLSFAQVGFLRIGYSGTSGPVPADRLGFSVAPQYGRKMRRNGHESRFLLLGVLKHLSQSEGVSLAEKA
jgi:hypothetical protein